MSEIRARCACCRLAPLPNGPGAHCDNCKRQMGARRRQLDALTAERDAARAALREIEWSVLGWHAGDHAALCPACRNPRQQGHTAECSIGAALNGHQTEGKPDGE